MTAKHPLNQEGAKSLPEEAQDDSRRIADRALEFLSAGQVEDCLAVLEAGEREFPASPHLSDAHARYCYKLGDHAGAMKHYQRYLDTLRPQKIEIKDPPLVSVIVATYNQPRYVREALASVFAQDYSPLEIVVFDDCSNDETFAIIKKICADYHGPHSLVLHRAESNLGNTKNRNTVMELSHGAFVICAHHDDISLPHRVSVMTKCWLDTGVDLVSSNPLVFEYDDKRLTNIMFDPNLSSRPTLDEYLGPPFRTISGATQGMSRELFDVFGPLPPFLCNDDILLPFRAALRKGIHVIQEPLLLCRSHNDNQNTPRQILLASGERKELLSERMAANWLGNLVYCLKTLRDFENHAEVGRYRSIDELNSAKQKLHERVYRASLALIEKRGEMSLGGIKHLLCGF